MADTTILTSLHGKRFGLDRPGNAILDRGDAAGPTILSSTAYTNVAASTALTASSTETLFSTNYSIPANTLVPGQLIKISYWGIVTASNASDTFASVLRIGGLAGTALFTHTATDATNNDIFLGGANRRSREHDHRHHGGTGHRRDGSVLLDQRGQQRTSGHARGADGVSALDEILARFGALPKDQQEAVVADAFAATKDAKFVLTRTT
jgi:hypothetical protein